MKPMEGGRQRRAIGELELDRTVAAGKPQPYSARDLDPIGCHTVRRNLGAGPSDKRAEQGRGSKAATKGGVDANATKDHLLKVAKRLDISGRSTMKKKQLVDAIQRVNTKKTAAARKK